MVGGTRGPAGDWPSESLPPRRGPQRGKKAVRVAVPKGEERSQGKKRERKVSKKEVADEPVVARVVKKTKAAPQAVDTVEKVNEFNKRQRAGSDVAEVEEGEHRVTLELQPQQKKQAEDVHKYFGYKGRALMWAVGTLMGVATIELLPSGLGHAGFGVVMWATHKVSKYG